MGVCPIPQLLGIWKSELNTEIVLAINPLHMMIYFDPGLKIAILFMIIFLLYSVTGISQSLKKMEQALAGDGFREWRLEVLPETIPCKQGFRINFNRTHRVGVRRDCVDGIWVNTEFTWSIRRGISNTLNLQFANGKKKYEIDFVHGHNGQDCLRLRDIFQDHTAEYYPV
jgi:hypothetical protein